MEEKEKLSRTDLAVIEITKEELQTIARQQFGRPLTENEIQALVDLSPIGLHDWIGLAIEAARVEEGVE